MTIDNKFSFDPVKCKHGFYNIIYYIFSLLQCIGLKNENVQ